MSVTVADVVAGAPAALSCAGVLNVPAGGTETCDYSAALAAPVDGTNTVTATLNQIDFTATAGYAFGAPSVTGYANIGVTDTNGPTWDASGDASWNYTKDFTCPTDKTLYVNGVYVAADHVNTATIDETGQSDTATVKLTCYAPVVSKDAKAFYGKVYTWTIDKAADAAYTKFIGDPATTHAYTVTVDQTVVDVNANVTGTITVHNPRPDAAMSVTVADVVAGAPATLTCGGVLNVPAGGTKTCDYSAALAAPVDGTNTVTATLNQIDFTATAGYAFGAPSVTGYANIGVTDTNGPTWDASGDASWNYTKDFTCPTDKTLYVNGVYVAADHVNTATIDETGQSDTATVKLTCYAPVATKTAKAEWQREYTWEIIKSVAPSAHSGNAGDQFTSFYTVTVDQSVVDSGYKASGTISVLNPAGSPGAMTVDVADLVDGTAATVDCDGATSLTVQPGDTEACTYTVSLPNATDRTNTATVTFHQIAFAASAAVDFGDPIVKGYPTINVSDFFDGSQTGQALGSASGDQSFTYTRPFACPIEGNAYTNGTYAKAFPNIAKIIETGQQDDANVTVDCDLLAGLGDLVWFDKDKDGQQDGDEPGIAGVKVELIQGTNVIATKFTDANGNYSFTGLPAGEYTVRFPTTGLTSLNQGSDASDSDADLGFGETTTKLDAGEYDPTLDAGYLPAALGDRVWIDTNKNGLQDEGELGIAGVKVELLQDGKVIATTTTNATGFYAFTGLKAGTYTVRFPTANLTDPGAGDPADDSNPDKTLGETTTILDWGEVDNTLDAGVVPVAEVFGKLGDFVWEDKNDDGVQNDGVSGVAGVTVNLKQGVNVISTTTTASDGTYLFDNLTEGEYEVCFVKPANFDFTEANSDNAANDAAVDSDAGEGGCTGLITLATGQTDLTWDGGLVKPLPTNEEEENQPGAPRMLYLPTVQTSTDGAALQAAAASVQDGAQVTHLPDVQQ